MAAPVLDLVTVDRLAREAGHAAVVAFQRKNDGMEEDENGEWIQGLRMPYDRMELLDEYTEAYQTVALRHWALSLTHGGRFPAYADPLIFTAFDNDGQANYYGSLLHSALYSSQHPEIEIRAAPSWALRMVLAVLANRRQAGEPNASWVTEFDEPNALQDMIDADQRMETQLEIELASRHHNAGRTLYLQTNAALGVERWFQRLAPMVNPTMMQTLVANFLSLSFNQRTPVIPRQPLPPAAAAAPRAAKRKGEDDDNPARVTRHRE